MIAHRDALMRTTLLLNQEWFSGREADASAIADALLASTVRLSADAQSISNRAGQSALVTAFMLIARLGIGIELIAPDVELIDPFAPLRPGRLVGALMDLGRDLIPGARVRTSIGEVDETFVFGRGEYDGAPPIYVSASDTDAVLERGSEPGACAGWLPFGGFAAGAACAALALEAARERIEDATGLSVRAPRPTPGPPVHIRLGELFPGLADAAGMDLGRLDVVSGGAITHALVFCLLRVPEARARIRVIEFQDADLSNLNRYSLLRASHKDIDKVDLLEAAATERIQIVGEKMLFTTETRDALLPMAGHVLVGVDDVRARWWVQETDPRWLAVGATGNNLTQVTTHEPGSPCAACLHPVLVPPGEIPTISFVSFWAGLLQTCALLTPVPPRSIVAHPFALGGSLGITYFEPVLNPQCPIGCSLCQSVAG